LPTPNTNNTKQNGSAQKKQKEELAGAGTTDKQQQPVKKKRGRPVGWRKADHSNKYKSMQEAAGNARKALGGQHKRYYSDEEDEYDSDDYNDGGGEAFNKYNTQGSDDEGNDRKRGRPSSSQKVKKQPPGPTEENPKLRRGRLSPRHATSANGFRQKQASATENGASVR
jgi:hypothetical protein